MDDDHTYKVHSAERELTPAFTLNQMGKVAYKAAVEDDRYPFLNLVTAQLMCALTMEAVLNRAGFKLFVEDAAEPAVWTAIERLGPKPKLLAIAERAKLQLEFGDLPFQDFGSIFRFRNQLVHARSMRLVTSDIPADALDDENWLDERKVPALQAAWERVCNAETAERWRDSVYGMSETVCAAVDCLNPVLIGDTASWSGSWGHHDGG